MCWPQCQAHPCFVVLSLWCPCAWLLPLPAQFLLMGSISSQYPEWLGSLYPRNPQLVQMDHSLLLPSSPVLAWHTCTTLRDCKWIALGLYCCRALYYWVTWEALHMNWLVSPAFPPFRLEFHIKNYMPHEVWMEPKLHTSELQIVSEVLLMFSTPLTACILSWYTFSIFERCIVSRIFRGFNSGDCWNHLMMWWWCKSIGLTASSWRFF